MEHIRNFTQQTKGYAPDQTDGRMIDREFVDGFPHRNGRVYYPGSDDLINMSFLIPVRR